MEKKTKTKKAASVSKSAPQGDIFAVVETGGKQYLMEAGKPVKVEKLHQPAKGAAVTFDKVLLVKDGKGVRLGRPYVEGAVVAAKWEGEGRHKKVTVFKYHSKTRYRKNKGHRQPFVKVTLESVK